MIQMYFNKDKQIRTAIPGLTGKTVLYIGSPENDLFPKDSGSWETLQKEFKLIGYKFIFVPELLETLSGQMSEYLFPGFELPDVNVVFERLQNLAGIKGKTGLIYKRRRYTYFRDLSKPGIDVRERISDLLELLSEPRIHKINVDSSLDNYDELAKDEDSSVRFRKFPTIACSEKQGAPRIRFSIERSDTRFREIPQEPLPWSESELDFETVYLLRNIRQFLEERHLSLEELEVLLGYSVQLSHLRIDNNGRIFLVDFGNKEVKMDHLTKMIYFFFLRHPEGVRMKEVDNYQDELLHLYLRITGRDDLDKIKASIARHTDPYGPNLNISSSRIRTAFRVLVGEKVAKFYCLEGTRGEPYSIGLDRDLVLWDYPE